MPGPRGACRVGRWFFLDQSRSRPARWFPARLRAEPGFLWRKPEERAPGALPPGPPPFIARSLLARSFWCWRRSGAVVGLFRSPPTCPDLETFFHKNAFQHIFSRKMRPKSVLAYRKKQSLDRIRDNYPQTPASGNERPSKPGVQGRSPGPLLSPFLGRNGDPRRAGGATGRCAPRLRNSPNHP